MTKAGNKHILILHKGFLKARGLNAAEMADAVSAWPEAPKVLVISGRSDGSDVIGEADGIVFIVGPHVLGAKSRAGYPAEYIDLDTPLNWQAGDRTSAALATIRLALDMKFSGERPEIRTESPPIPLSESVLIFGSGDTARRAAALAAKAGLSVTWAQSGTPVGEAPEDNIEIVPCQNIKKIHGFIGRFTVTLETGAGLREVPAGAVWLCGTEARFEIEPLPGVHTISLSEWEKELAGKLNGDDSGNGAAKVAVLPGPNGSTSTAGMERMLSASILAARHKQERIHVFVPHVKVAETGLERLYGQARDEGVLFIRTPDGGPEIIQEDSGKAGLRVFDPTARAHLTLHPDLAVMDEPLKSDMIWKSKTRELGLTAGPDGFPAPDNVLFLSARTNRAGIFALGPARGTDSQGLFDSELADALAETMRIIGTKDITLPQPLDNRVLVDEGRCASCLICLRSCPQGAIYFTKRPWPDPAACIACGICVARCPARALSLVDALPPEGLRRVVFRPHGDESTFVPRIVVFGCERSAMSAMKSAPIPETDTDLVCIPLPCGGNLDEKAIWLTLQTGADGVMIAVCHPDNCRTQRGNKMAKGLADRFEQTAGVIRLLDGRVRIVHLAPNSGQDFTLAVLEFQDALKQVGPIIKTRP